MNILISNDDGVHAPGINVLAKVLSTKHDVTVIAPLEERSTTGHTLSLDNPLRMVKLSEGVYGCSGFPADCTLMGLGHLLKDNPPDIVITGINRGANLGQDIYYSGTVAAAREASFHGFRSIAVSLVNDFAKSNSTEHYETAANFVLKTLDKGIVDYITPLNVVNINAPNICEQELKGVELTTLGFRRYSEEIQSRDDFRGRPYYWIGGIFEGSEGGAGTDCHAIEQGKISVSLLNLMGTKVDKNKNWPLFIDQLNQ